MPLASDTYAYSQPLDDPSNKRLLCQDLPGRGGGDRLLLLVDKDRISSQGGIGPKSQDTRVQDSIT